MLCYITYAKVFHSSLNFAAGIFCSQKIQKAMKNCALIFMAAFLFFPALCSAEEPASDSRAKPTVPSGFIEIPVSLSYQARFQFTGNNNLYFYYRGHTLTNTLYQDILNRADSDIFLNGAVYIRNFSFSPSYRLLYQDSGGNWKGPYTGHFNPSGTFSSQAHPTPLNSLNTVMSYFPYNYPVSGYGDFGKDTLDYTLKLQYLGDSNSAVEFVRGRKYEITIDYVVSASVFVNSSLSSLLDAIDKLDTRVFQIYNRLGDTNKKIDTVNNNLNTINNNINSVNTKLNNINTSIKNGFTDTINNIKKQTTTITNNADKNANKITANQDKNTQKILDQNSQFRDEDRAEAEGIGKIAQDFLDTNVSKAKSNFNILWEPIAFTQRVISVFSGGTRSSTYANYLNGVVGFNYNPDTGCLDPILDLGPKSRYGKASEGTTITFPSYTLPVLNLKLWDSYTFDLKIVKDNFSVLFNVIYVVSGCLCLYWFLRFLSDKFEEVFKE